MTCALIKEAQGSLLAFLKHHKRILLEGTIKKRTALATASACAFLFQFFIFINNKSILFINYSV